MFRVQELWKEIVIVEGCDVESVPKCDGLCVRPGN